MQRAFTEDDNAQPFTYVDPQGTRHTGTLEYPLDDPGSATAEEGVLWFDQAPRRIGTHGYYWLYVRPGDVEPITVSVRAPIGGRL